MTPAEHFMLKTLFYGEIVNGILFLFGIGIGVYKFSRLKTRIVKAQAEQASAQVTGFSIIPVNSVGVEVQRVRVPYKHEKAGL